MMQFRIYFHQFVMKKLLKKYLKEKKIFYVDIGTNEGNFLDYLKKFLHLKNYLF